MTEEVVSGEEEAVRERIGAMMKGGLKTEAYPRASDSDAVNAVVARLQADAPDDLEAKLVIAGFTEYPIEDDDIEQSCETCMYYRVHQRFCELPELMVPVEAEWSCRLWRI